MATGSQQLMKKEINQETLGRQETDIHKERN
jgi:hypothetical protein